MKIENAYFSLRLPLVKSSWIKLAGSFLVGQGALQLIQVLSGFFLIRWLSVEQYAQYSVAFAFQSTAGMLVELGFSGAIVALVGNRIQDKKVLGNYIRAGRFFRNRLFLIIGGFCLVLFPLFTAKHGWSTAVTIVLLICILSNLYFSGHVSYYSPPLIIHQRLKDLYGIQIKNGIARFLFLALFQMVSALSAGIAAVSTSLLTIANGLLFKRRSQALVEEPKTSDPKVRKEMLDYLKPIMPGTVFMAFQAQILVFIISIFGESRNIAEIAALGRLGQLFLLLNIAGTTLIAPYFARQPKEGLMPKFALVVGGAVILSFGIWIFSYAFPEALIFLIGSKYQHLEREIPLLVFSSCLAFISNLMWAVVASRKWLWWWMPVLNIGGIVLIQILAVTNMDLATTRNVLILSILMNAYAVIHKLIVATYGFTRTSRG